ncbi:hypothetical protein B0J17DRAFT_678203 [Rhizoctonia solani]|nr:hypothetical protein B0J17DRAFT_678203 [Rhizoctonia solani]
MERSASAYIITWKPSIYSSVARLICSCLLPPLISAQWILPLPTSTPTPLRSSSPSTRRELVEEDRTVSSLELLTPIRSSSFFFFGSLDLCI